MLLFKKPALNHEKLKQGSFKDEFNTYLRLKEIFKDKKLKKDKIIFFNPGAGGDIINPLLFIDALIECKNLEMIFMDPRFYYSFVIEALKDVVENFKYKLKLNGNTAQISFRLNRTKCSMVYVGKDAFERIPDEIKKGFDIYYERAFRLFRDDQNLYMSLIFEKMNKGGLVVTDWGFNKPIIEKGGLKKIENIPKDFGIYKNLTIYKKL